MTGRKKNHTKSLLNSVSFFSFKNEKKKSPKIKNHWPKPKFDCEHVASVLKQRVTYFTLCVLSGDDKQQRPGVLSDSASGLSHAYCE